MSKQFLITSPTKEVQKIVEKLKLNPEKSVDLYIDSVDELICYNDYSTKDKVTLNEDIAEYLLQKAKDITINYSVCINLHIKNKGFDDSQLADKVIHNYFAKKTEELVKAKKKKSAQWRIRFIRAILFLSTCHGASLALSMMGKDAAIVELLQDSLEIVGWVAIWEPALYFIYTRKEESYELSDYVQLKNCVITLD